MTKAEREQFARIKSGLKCSDKEAMEIMEYDKAVDHDEKTPYDLTPAQNEVARKYAHTGTRKAPPAYKFTKRERKPNATKGGIITELSQFLTNDSEYEILNVTITNAERQIAFQIGEERFELTLVQKRKPKG